MTQGMFRSAFKRSSDISAEPQTSKKIFRCSKGVDALVIQKIKY